MGNACRFLGDLGYARRHFGMERAGVGQTSVASGALRCWSGLEVAVRGGTPPLSQRHGGGGVQSVSTFS